MGFESESKRRIRQLRAQRTYAVTSYLRDVDDAMLLVSSLEPVDAEQVFKSARIHAEKLLQLISEAAAFNIALMQ